MRLDLGDERIRELMQAFATPYVWGAGQPSDALRPDWYLGQPSLADGAPKPCPAGFDCNGYASVALVRLGIIPATAPKRNCATLITVATPINEGVARLGDLVFYGKIARPTHVMVYVGGGLVLGAQGGGSTTWGNDPGAYVKVEKFDYRSDVLGFRRMG